MDNLSKPNRAMDDEDRFAAGAGHSSSNWLSHFQHCLTEPVHAPTPFTSPNTTAETYRTLRLRAFGKRKAGAMPLLIVTPFAVHDAGFVDLMRGHSLVQTLGAANAGPVHVTDWISATPDMAQLSIDNYLADLNVAIDDLGGQAHVIGLGVGGCLALLHAARFPGKITRLVLAGTPVDIAARPSLVARFAAKAVECAEIADECTINGAQRLAPLGAAHGHERAAMEALQRNPASFTRADLDAIQAFEDWTMRSPETPGRTARELLTHIFAENQLARGEFIALGRKIDLRDVKIPLFVLAGARDEIAPKLQALSVLKRVGTAKTRQRSLVAPCGHFALFVGASALAREWRTIAGWLGSSRPDATRPSRARRTSQLMDGSTSSNRP